MFLSKTCSRWSLSVGYRAPSAEDADVAAEAEPGRVARRKGAAAEENASAKCSRRGGGCNTSHHQESKTTIGCKGIYSRRWPGADVGLRESWWSLDRERWLRARPNPLRRSARLSARRALRRSALEEGEGRCLAPPGVEDRKSDERLSIYSRRWPGADVGLRESWWSLDREKALQALTLRRNARLSARRALRRSALEEGEGAIPRTTRSRRPMSPKSVRFGISVASQPIYSRRWPGADVGLRESWWSLDRERCPISPLRRNARLSARRALRRSALEEGEGRCLAPPGVEDRNRRIYSRRWPGADVGLRESWWSLDREKASLDRNFVETRACPREERFGEVLSKRGRVQYLAPPGVEDRNSH